MDQAARAPVGAKLAHGHSGVGVESAPSTDQAAHGPSDALVVYGNSGLDDEAAAVVAPIQVVRAAAGLADEIPVVQNEDWFPGEALFPEK